MSKKELDVITLRGLSAVGSHGVHEFERSGVQVFSADIKLHLDVSKAAETDQVEHTVDYSAMAEDAVTILTGPPVYLIETLANRLAEMALTYPLVQMAEVTVHKPMAPVRHRFSDVSVTVRRRQGRKDPDYVGTTSTVVRPAKSPDEPTEPKTLVTPLPSRRSLHKPVEQDGPQVSEPSAIPAPEAPEPVRTPEPAHASVPSKPRLPSRVERHSLRGRTDDISASTELVGRGPKFAPLERNRSFDDAAHVYQVVLALGSNQGDVLANLSGAVEALASLPGFEVEAVSPLVRTEPVLEPGALPQSDFYNAVLLGRTVIAPPMLLLETQYIERQFGRTSARRWSPRTLDIDIIMIDRIRVSNKNLQLPHPRAAQRAFVLYPWSLVDPEAELIDGTPVKEALDSAPDKAGVLSVQEDWLGSSEPLGSTARNVELAPRASKSHDNSVGATSPAVEVRGEKLHLASIDGDPIFQKLLDAEVANAVVTQTVPSDVSSSPTRSQGTSVDEPASHQSSSHAAPASPVSHPAEVPVSSDAKTPVPTRSSTVVRPGSRVSAGRQHVAAQHQLDASSNPRKRPPRPARPIPTHVASAVHTPVDQPESQPPSAPLGLPDWRATITPAPTRVIDDGGRSSATPTTSANSVLREPTTGISRRATIRPTPTGTVPVVRQQDGR